MEQNLFEGVGPEQTEAFMECLDLMYGNLEAMCARQEKAHAGTENCSGGVPVTERNSREVSDL